MSKQDLQQLNQTFLKEDLAALFVSIWDFCGRCYLFLKIPNFQKKDEW
ncbi:N-acetyltransferase [Streptococcus ruminantium]|uniref:N-acetyltransferase n=1 Tax=Streptococcus ruminantium TaxID=1917441 RepID=A0A2Z5U252_9STRE|nr:N-acetyltransferase [Streptococcus ruminantium]